MSRIEEDGRNWFRRPKLSINSCRTIIRRRGTGEYCLEILSHAVCKIGTNISKGLAAPSSGYIAGLIFYPEYRGC